LQANGIWASLSSAERASLEKPVGSWSKQEISNGQWRGDALGVLLWPIQRNDQLLPCDQPMFGENLDKSFPPPSGAAHFIKNAKLRDADEIRKAKSPNYGCGGLELPSFKRTGLLRRKDGLSKDY